MINNLIKLLETKYQHRIPFTIYCELMSDIWMMLAEENQVNVKTALNAEYGKMVTEYQDTDSVKDKSSCMYDLFDTHL